MTTTNTNNKRQIEESPVKERKRRDLGTDKAPSSVPAASTASVSEEAVAAAAVAAAAVAAAADNSSQRTSLVGTIAPQFTATAVLPDGAFQDVSLSDFADKHTVVLFADNSCFSPESTFAAELPAFSAAITSNASGSSECHGTPLTVDGYNYDS
ncbi:hypothetical protein GQ42DRAFT_154789 [Ramicandelaber brevisporus]|nr:hypothetical protein GQ42DRAFT_154789 [Ramicandelaber brevisporus]